MDKLETLLKDHGATLLLFVRQWVPDASDAEDVLQEAVLKYWRSGHFVEENPKYLFACVRNAAMDFLRQNSRRKKRENRTIQEQQRCQEPSLSGPLEQENLRIQIENALGNLSVEQREVVVMKIWGELTFAEIAETLNIPSDTAASRYRYAMARLRQNLSRESII